jgi:sec-independent protein translocase protein TatA
MFGSLGTPEILLIVFAIILLFGVGKLSGLGRDLGASIKEFRRAVKDPEEEAKEAAEKNVAATKSQAQTPAAPPPPPPSDKSPNVF